jgi:transmembrane sensor
MTEKYFNSSNINWVEVARYLDNTGTPAERASIEHRIATDPEFATEIKQIRTLWATSAINWVDIAMYNSDVQSDWVKIQRKIKSGEQSDGLRSADESVRASVRRTPRIRRTYYHMLRLAAILVFMVLSSLALTYLLINPEPEVTDVVFREISTDRNQRASVQLSDGTKVNLSVESRLRMPDVFARDVREVDLIGEARFDVAHSPNRPFIIRSGNTVVRVLGTDFNVRAYPNESEIQVVVKSGSVAVEASHGNESRSVVLVPGQLARISLAGQGIDTRWVNPDNYLGWINGRLAFEEALFTDVIRQLERWYDLEIILENAEIEQQRFTALIDSRSLNNVLNVVSQSMDLSYEVIDNKVFLRNKNPNP